MDLVDKKDISLLQIGQQRGQISRLFDRRSGGGADLHPHLVGHDAGEGRLAKTRRPVEQQMIQRFPPPARSLEIDPQIALDLF